MLAIEPVLLEIGKARSGGGDQGERGRGQIGRLDDSVERGLGGRRQQLLDGASDIGGREGFDAGAITKMAVPIAAEARQGLNHRDALAGSRAEARPVAATENPDYRSANCRRKMECARIVADVKAGGV